MVFIKSNWMLSTDSFYIKKFKTYDLKFQIYLLELKNNKEYILATFDNEKEQEELFNNILQAIYNKSYYLKIEIKYKDNYLSILFLFYILAKIQ